MRLTDLLALSHVPRWPIVRTLAPQTVSDHTFRVCVIARELADEIKVELTADDYWWIVCHDAAESRTGDAPPPFKSRVGNFHEIELDMCPWIRHIKPIFRSKEALIKAADLIETWTYIRAWGIGPHAAAVGERIRGKMIAHCRAWDLVDAATRISRSIIDEEGRASD